MSVTRTQVATVEQYHDFPSERITAQRGWLALHLLELWAHRGLLYLFIWREIMVRYKQLWITAACAVLQPALTMNVFRLFFGKLANQSSTRLIQDKMHAIEIQVGNSG